MAQGDSSVVHPSPNCPAEDQQMVNAPSHDSPIGFRPRATGLVASALLLVISVAYATAAGAVPPTSDREKVSGTFTRNADNEPLTVNLIDATDAELDGPGRIGWCFPEPNSGVRRGDGRRIGMCQLR